MINLLDRPHTLFLWLALTFGAIFVIITPPCNVPDEASHFLRIANLARGGVLMPMPLPKTFAGLPQECEAFSQHGSNSLRDIAARLRAMGDEDENVQSPLYGAIGYSPAPYLGALPVVWYMLKSHAAVYPVFYMARFGIFLTSTLLLYTAIRLTPVFKWQLFFLSLFPVSVFFRSSVNADPLTLSYIFLFIALVLRSLDTSDKIAAGRITAMAIVSVLLCLSKGGYIFLPLLFFLLPCHRFASYKIYILSMIGIVVLPILCQMAWMFTIHKFFAAHLIPDVPVHHNILFGKPIGSDERQQLIEISHHPLVFMLIVFATAVTNLFDYIYQMVGVLGLLDIPMDISLCFVQFVMLFAVGISDNKKYLLVKLPEKILLLSVFFITAGFILFTFYVIYSPVNASTIVGIQGRYFLPIMPLLLLAIPRISCSEKARTKLIRVIVLITIIQLVLAVSDTYDAYYL